MSSVRRDGDGSLQMQLGGQKTATGHGTGLADSVWVVASGGLVPVPVGWAGRAALPVVAFPCLLISEACSSDAGLVLGAALLAVTTWRHRRAAGISLPQPIYEDSRAT